jgi:GTP pyrophosphokinase
MVKVREDHPLHYDGSINLDLWLEKIVAKAHLADDVRLRSACELSWRAEQKAIAADHIWAVGKSSFQSGLDMADILAELCLDEDSLVAGVIYRAVREQQLPVKEVEERLGKSVSLLVQGVLRMAAISGIKIMSEDPVLGQTQDQVEQARKMFVSLVDDVRVALIKLAERTCAIRKAKIHDAEKQIALAREVFDIYAPLAHRLGIGHLKWELEDLAFRYLEADAYVQIANLLDEKRGARQEYVDKVLDRLSQTLKVMKIDAQLEGRVKHIYSIWQKMIEKGIPFSQVYDVSAVRIMVHDENDCYRVLGAVHKLWHNIPNEFDDYIATPKENGYRSLHTAVFGPAGKVIEVQIRTFEMHEEAELGVCSHWRYKSGEQSTKSDSYEQKINWLRQLLEWQEELGELPGIAKELIGEVSQDRIYVFTPDGHVVDLMPIATPLDFAYKVHTEVGHRCCGARVNGHIASLNSKLHTGDQVEIITEEDASPRREWLYDHLGYLNTSRARVKVQNWFRSRDRAKNISEGQQLLAREFDHLGFKGINYDSVTEPLGFSQVDDLFAAVGSSELSSRLVIEAVQELEGIDSSRDQMNLELDSAEASVTNGEVTVSGAGKLPVENAECCKPVPGDPIVGVIVESNRVIVHRKDCLNLLHLGLAGKLIEIIWETVKASTFPVNVLVNAYDRSGLMFDVTSVLLTEQLNMSSVHTEMDSGSNVVSLMLTLEVKSLDKLLRLLERIEQIPNVIEARRIDSVIEARRTNNVTR